MSQIDVIIPVYNAVKTLDRCISSLLGQSFHDIRILMVDDASTDETWNLMLMLEKRDPERICAIQSDINRGPGGARNIALEYLDAPYVCFVDSDDYVASWFCEKLWTDAVNNGYDIVDIGYYDESADMSVLKTPPDLRGELDNEKRNRLITHGGYLWSKIFKSTLFIDNNIRFREKCSLEDSEILIELIARSGSIGGVEDVSYWYTYSDGSLSKSWTAGIYVKTMSDAIRAICELQKRIDNYDELRDSIDYMMMSMYNFAIQRTLMDYRDEKTLDSVKILTELRDIRFECIRSGYNNRFYIERIAPGDMQIIKLNDEDPIKLVRKFNRRSEK